MRFVVLGTGGVGGYFGALLAAARNDVTFVARGAQLEALRAGDLCVQSSFGDFVVRDPQVCPPGSAVPGVDVAIVAVKGYQIEAATPTLERVCSKGTRILLLMNGVEPAEYVAARFPAHQLLVAQVTVGAWQGEPGTIIQEGPRRGLTIGRWPRADDADLAELCRLLRAAGAECETTDDIERMAWRKLIWAASYAGLAGLARATAGETRSSPDLRQLVADALREGASVAARVGIDLDPDEVVEHWLSVLDGLKASGKTSLLRDLEHGRPLELEALSGTIRRKGREVGVPTPIHDIVYALLGPAHRRALAPKPG